ncbi:MAG TPA: hypothetical protein VF644_13445 [Pyrinomonadaceae bacterium]|jgi:hypothetical protein
MKTLNFFLILIVVVCFGTTIKVSAQNSNKQVKFEGEWNWAVYGKNKSQMPPDFRDDPAFKIEDVPQDALDISIERKGSKIIGTLTSLSQFNAYIDDTKFRGIIKDNIAEIKLKSNFGGTVVVELKIEGDNLYWKKISQKGENWLPTEVALRRLGKNEFPPYYKREITGKPIQ